MRHFLKNFSPCNEFQIKRTRTWTCLSIRALYFFHDRIHANRGQQLFRAARQKWVVVACKWRPCKGGLTARYIFAALRNISARGSGECTVRGKMTIYWSLVQFLWNFGIIVSKLKGVRCEGKVCILGTC